MSRPTNLALSIFGAVLMLPTASAAQNSVLMLLPTDDRELEVGREFTGALSASDYSSPDDYLLEAWELEGRAGQTVTVDLVSDGFDGRLFATGPGFSGTLSADDGAGGCNPRLGITFLENGTFRIVASSHGETGTYTLSVTDRPTPAPAYGCGEMNPEALAELPTDGRTLELGSLQVGVLGATSRIVQDGRPGEAWELRGTAGQRLSVTLESDEFDAYLYLTGPGLSQVLTDDDGAGDLNSRIDVTLPTDGPYTVVAAALSAGNFGPYTIRVGEPIDPTAAEVVRFVESGETANGTLFTSDSPILGGRRGQIWGFEATAGQRVLIDLVSDDFDTYLYVAGPGLNEPLSDDDGGDDTNSQLTVTFPESGTYRIIPSAYGSSGSGGFTVTITPL